MKYYIFSAIVQISLIMLAGCSNPVNISNPANINSTNLEKQLISSNQSFGLNLLTQVNETAEDSNISISPLSVSTALGMTINGANGATYSQMKSTLQLPGSSQTDVNQAYLNLSKTLAASDPSVSFTTANSIWSRKGLSFEQSFLNVNQQYFNAFVQSLDFTNPASVKTINNWVNTNTDGKITQIINNIPADAVMYLINAIYFKANWTNKFDSSLTKQSPFLLANGTTVQCAMMYQENNFNYYRGSNYSALQIPYGNGNFNMVIILPNSGVDVNQLLSQVDASLLEQINTGMTMQDVKLYLPRFEMSFSTLLKNPLIDLGMVDAFSPSADFSKISNTMPLKISDVLHKTYLKVGEKGTEAAAVTAVIIVTAVVSIPAPGLVFDVNHPFIFLITEKNSGAILFAGKTLNPSN
ncbi:MAG: serpin family protein [Ignavibacteriaceae bacterium]